MGPRFEPEQDQMDRMERILDAAEEEGMQIILCCAAGYWRHLQEVGEQAYRRDLQRAADRLADHPAVLGFHVGDEPRREDFPYVCRAFRIQREIAPKLTPFCNLMNSHPGAEKLTGYLDW
jgi:sugar phosphate isomerase/epimerase